MRPLSQTYCHQPPRHASSALPHSRTGIDALARAGLRRSLAGSSRLPEPNRVHLSLRSVWLFPLLPTPPRGDAVTSTSRRCNGHRRSGSPTQKEARCFAAHEKGFQTPFTTPAKRCPILRKGVANPFSIFLRRCGILPPGGTKPRHPAPPPKSSPKLHPPLGVLRVRMLLPQNLLPPLIRPPRKPQRLLILPLHLQKKGRL